MCDNIFNLRQYPNYFIFNTKEKVQPIFQIKESTLAANPTTCYSIKTIHDPRNITFIVIGNNVELNL